MVIENNSFVLRLGMWMLYIPFHIWRKFHGMLVYDLPYVQERRYNRTQGGWFAVWKGGSRKKDHIRWLSTFLPWKGSSRSYGIMSQRKEQGVFDTMTLLLTVVLAAGIYSISKNLRKRSGIFIVYFYCVLLWQYTMQCNNNIFIVYCLSSSVMILWNRVTTQAPHYARGLTLQKMEYLDILV